MPPPVRADEVAIPEDVVAMLAGAEARLPELATPAERREAICQVALRCHLEGPAVWAYLDATGLLPPWPKAAAVVDALAREHGWRIHEAQCVDTGGSPYLNLTLWAPRGCKLVEFRLTWHTRDHGSFRLYSMLRRAMDGRGWTEPRSLAAVRAELAAPLKED